mgnify:CR=1 FL=1
MKRGFLPSYILSFFYKSVSKNLWFISFAFIVPLFSAIPLGMPIVGFIIAMGFVELNSKPFLYKGAYER